MRALPAVLTAALLAISGGPSSGSPSPAADGRLAAAPCPRGLKDPAVRCGTFQVYEDPIRRGRTIDLYFVVLKAAHPNGRAIFWNPGGPGAATTPAAQGLADGLFQKEIAALRDQYDILLVDTRGIGRSHSLNCGLMKRATVAERYRELWPSRALGACRAALAGYADPNQYTTINAVDDLDRLRAALGYSKLVLDGDSYGTYISFIYMRRHPERTEAAVLDGVAPPGFLTVPLEDAKGAQLAMGGLIAACSEDAACRARFPDFASRFRAVARRFELGPVLMPVKDGERPVRMSKQVFADRLRQVLYSNNSAAYVPFAVDRAYLGDYRPLSRLIDATTLGIMTFVEPGANLSYVCAEQLPFITEPAVRRTSAGTFMGDARVRAEQRACAIWRVRPSPRAAFEPVRTDLPILMVSGSDDPASPAEFGTRALPLLPNAGQVIVRGAAHVTETPCTDELKIAFVRAGSVRGLDLSKCAADFTRPPFATGMDSFNR
jgi:pimeloyl-ACP methyl ester carboxylesterase